jgi:biofilm protein TabA
MIVGELLSITTQAALNSRIVQALNFLSGTQLAELPDGQIEIAGSQVFAILSTYHTHPIAETIEIEGHRKYLDFQYIVQGEELIGWVPETAVPAKSPYDDKREAWLGRLPAGELSWIRLTSGLGMLLYPDDGHAPQYAPGEPSLVRKIVVKIAV